MISRTTHPNYDQEGETLMESTQDKAYNGWTNYATWGVKLVLDNERSTYDRTRAMAEGTRKAAPTLPQVEDGIWTVEQAEVFNLSALIKDFTEDLCDQESSEGTMMARQVIQAGLAEVNWDEIAENILSET